MANSNLSWKLVCPNVLTLSYVLANEYLNLGGQFITLSIEYGDTHSAQKPPRLAHNYNHTHLKTVHGI